LKQIVVLSGKGGTGKTTVSAALAHLAGIDQSLVLADADVDAANLELVLAPEQREVHEFWSGQIAVIDPEACSACGRCAEVCRFGAIIAPSTAAPAAADAAGTPYAVDEVACEGCAACHYQCAADAIRMIEQQAGRWYRSDTRYGPLFHAHLLAGRENSGKLVSQVKQQAQLWAIDHGSDWLIVDGPPGIGCPVISASAGADLALLVVEPTLSGVHDLERVLATVEHFRVPAKVVINKADLNARRADEIVVFCDQASVPIAGRIPYDPIVTEAMVHGVPVSEYTNGSVAQALKGVWNSTRAGLTKTLD
jgi:MinD superfamily P-loop ATPase